MTESVSEQLTLKTGKFIKMTLINETQYVAISGNCIPRIKSNMFRIDYIIVDLK